jgi:hypothetical protein
MTYLGMYRSEMAHQRRHGLKVIPKARATAVPTEVGLVARPPVNIVVRDSGILINGSLCNAAGRGAGEDEGIEAYSRNS